MDGQTLRELDRKHYLHPFTNHLDMHPQGTHVIQKGEGVYVTDDTGKRLLDGLAGLWCVNVGYGRREIIDAVTKQLQTLAFYPSFFNSTTEPTILLAEKVTKLAGQRISHVFFSDSGSEANETALKLIRGYYKIKGTPQKSKVLTLNYGYHGVTVTTTSMTQLPSCQTPFNLPLPGFIQVPGPYHWGARTEKSPAEYGKQCLEETEKLIQKEGAETIAALFCEPVQGAGGVVVPPEGYVRELRELCRKHKILFVADEVITAWGRLGAWFGSTLFKLDPDLITTAKGITSGYVPLGATLLADEVADTIIKGGYLATGNTYSGHPVACAAALANIGILEKDGLIERTRDVTGPYFQKKLNELRGHPAVGETRGIGLIGAVELLPRGGKAALDPAKPVLGPKALKIGREEGVVVRGIRDLMAMAPPLTITEPQIDELFAGVRRTLDRLWD